MFTVSAYVDALVLVQSGEMISSNYTSFGVAMNSGWCWHLLGVPVKNTCHSC